MNVGEIVGIRVGSMDGGAVGNSVGLSFFACPFPNLKFKTMIVITTNRCFKIIMIEKNILFDFLMNFKFLVNQNAKKKFKIIDWSGRSKQARNADSSWISSSIFLLLYFVSLVSIFFSFLL
jgi:hypothetical protein